MPQNALKSLAATDIPDAVAKVVAAGILRTEFVHGANAETWESIKRFADHYVKASKNNRSRMRIGELMIQNKILDPRLVENTIVADFVDQKTNRPTVKYWGTRLGAAVTLKLQELIMADKLGPALLFRLLGHEAVLMEALNTALLAKAATPGASNIITWGITETIEHEAVQTSIRNGSSRRDEFYTERNRLLKAFRATEGVGNKRMQIERVVPSSDNRHVLRQLADVWQYYAARSKLFRDIDAELPITDVTRAKNVTCVNAWQAQQTGHQPQEPQKRFIDIYGRYNHAEMDPLMLAIIARTVGWYIDNAHASLFTHIRLVPDRCGYGKEKLDATPWAALAFYPSMSLFKAEDAAFKESLRGANRMFLTHSRALDAVEQHSIPIIGLATWKNHHKTDFISVKSTNPYALLAADFDRRDPHRDQNRYWTGDDHALSFRGVIHETLRAVREVETLEIARANGVELTFDTSFYTENRWSPAPQTPAASPARHLMGAHHGS